VARFTLKLPKDDFPFTTTVDVSSYADTKIGGALNVCGLP